MKRFKGFRGFVLGLAGLVLLFGASALVIQRGSADTATRPRVLVLDPASAVVRPKPTLFERWVPRGGGWGWLWRTRELLCGRRKVVKVEAFVMGFSQSPEAGLAAVLRSEGTAVETNGISVWLVGGERTSGLRRELGQNGELLSRPSVTTVDRGLAKVLNGTSIPTRGAPLEAGLKMELLPAVRGDSIDLQTAISFSELVATAAAGVGETDPMAALTVQTNFCVNARLQLTNGGGAFLVDARSGAGGGKRVGVLLSVKVERPKK